MRFAEQLALILALAMDGFAASICMGLSLPAGAKALRAAAVVTAFHVALFAAGHSLGAFCAPVAAVMPWIGGALLAALGGGMLRQALRPEEPVGALPMRRVAALAFSTSVDAMTAGFSFALLSVPLGGPLALVAGVMGALACFGVWAGQRLGARFRRGARLAGGAVLLGLGVRNLLALL